MHISYQKAVEPLLSLLQLLYPYHCTRVDITTIQGTTYIYSGKTWQLRNSLLAVPLFFADKRTPIISLVENTYKKVELLK